MTAPAVTDRDAGLKRAIGAWGLGANVFNTVVGAGIFVLPAALAREAGAQAPWAYVACTVMTAAVVICFAEAGSRTPTSGGPYGFAQAAFGPFVGFLTGVLVWLGSVLACAGIAAALAGQAARLWPVLASPATRTGVIVALLGTLTAVNLRSVAAGSRLVDAMTLLKLLPLALLLAGGALFAVSAPQPAPLPAHGEGLGRAMLLAIFAFQGMETALGVSGEVRDPHRNVPRGLIGAMAVIALLYMAVQLIAQRTLGAGLAQSTAPLADAGRAIWAPLGPILLAGTAASMLGYVAGDILSAPRVLFAFARDGILPERLGRLGARSAVPSAAIVTHVVIAAVLAVTGGFEELVLLAALASAGVYVIGCVAAVVLQRRGVALAGPPLQVRGLWLAALIGIAGMAWLAVNAKPQELAGLGVTLVLGAGLYALARRRS